MTMHDQHTHTPRIRTVRRGPWLQWGSPRGFTRVEVELPVAGLAPSLRGRRIVHLSDLHFQGDDFSEAHQELIDLLASDPPDLILITGDFVDDKLDHR